MTVETVVYRFFNVHILITRSVLCPCFTSVTSRHVFSRFNSKKAWTNDEWKWCDRWMSTKQEQTTNQHLSETGTTTRVWSIALHNFHWLKLFNDQSGINTSWKWPTFSAASIKSCVRNHNRCRQISLKNQNSESLPLCSSLDFLLALTNVECTKWTRL